jgi:hypothetical protein
MSDLKSSLDFEDYMDIGLQLERARLLLIDRAELCEIGSGDARRIAKAINGLDAAKSELENFLYAIFPSKPKEEIRSVFYGRSTEVRGQTK